MAHREGFFEHYLTHVPEERRMHLIAATDAAFMCDQWFRSQGIEPTAAAIVAMTALVLQREDRAGDR